MKIVDYLVQDSEEELGCQVILHRAQFPVNMRLYKSSAGYREIILQIVAYLTWHLDAKYEDYPDPRGVSAAILGLPFSIIAYKDNSNKVRVCLNPVIRRLSGSLLYMTTACGAAKNRSAATNVERHETIDLEFHDLDGNRVLVEKINRAQGSLVIQHEVAHCLGHMPGTEQNVFNFHLK